MRPVSLVAAVWLLAVLALSSDAGVGILGLYLYLGGALSLATWWIMRLANELMGRQRSSATAHRWRWQWMLVPLMLVAGVLAGVGSGPHSPLFLARFRLSEAALTGEAQRRLQAPPDRVDLTRRRVGLFRVRQTEVVNGQVRFITTSCGVVDSCGVIYAPTSAPARWQEDVFSPISGRWWHLLQAF
jgi:hypothetical protein